VGTCGPIYVVADLGVRMTSQLRAPALVALLVVLVVVQAATPVAATAREPPTRELSDPAEFESYVDGVMASHMESHRIPGATVAVVKDGELFFSKGYGYADVEERTPVRANRTLFRVGSVSKLVTYTAVMQGVEDGRLDLDTDVNRYLADSEVTVPATYEEPVTLRHLGTHTAGFEDTYEGLFLYEQSDLQPLEAALADSRPARVRPPGTYAAYSNWGAALAGHVVAEETDTAYDEYVETNVFEPLGMERSTFRQPTPDRLADDMATGYRYRNGAYEAGRFEYVGIPPAGSMGATATDMARFMNAHLQDGATAEGRILNASTVETMHSRQFSHDPRLNGMAYGFAERDRNGERILGHDGATELFHTQMILLPEHDVGLFVSYNAPGGAVAGPRFVESFLDRYYPGAEAPALQTPEGAAERATDLTGEYRSTRVPYTSWWKFAGLAQTVSVRATPEGDLVTSFPAGEQFGIGSTRWVEVEPMVYREVGGDDTMVFDDDGPGGMHLFFGSNPAAAFGRVAWWETADVTLTVALGSLALLLSAALLWLVLAAYRWRTGMTAWSRRTWAARGLVAALGGLLAAFLAGLASVSSDPYAVFAGGSTLLDVTLALPWVAALLTLGVVGVAGLAWRDREWGLGTRLHYTLLALVALVVVWELYYWQFLV
jgi:CubicO group peptidase (beta-lactamase class C family)